jgi:hypothetical protein
VLTNKPAAFLNSDKQPNGFNRKGRNRRGLYTRAIYSHIQPYTAHNRVVVTTKMYRNFTSSVGAGQLQQLLINNSMTYLYKKQLTRTR